MPFVPRTKDARAKLAHRTRPELRTVTLTCGHETSREPTVSNPDRWFCCNQWRRPR